MTSTSHNLSELHLATTSVISSTNSSFALPWTTVKFNQSYSVLDFFVLTVKPCLNDSNNSILQAAQVRKDIIFLV